METKTFSFHKIKVAKALKNLSVRRYFPMLYIGVALLSVAVHFRCSLATMEETSLPAPAE